VRVNIDPKHDAAVDPLIALVRRLGVLDRVCFGAFSDRRLSRLREALGPGACTSMGPRQVGRLVAASRHLPGGTFTAACVQVPVRQNRIPLVTERFLEAAHARDLPVHVWTINEAEEMGRLLDMGVDGIMTDRPDVLKAVLTERGSWVS
jgi:glycerophosphoryl diester phosphodiesterase